MQQWCENTNVAVGEIITLEQCWRLAKEWYADRGKLTWQPKSAEAAAEIFKRVGLDGEFWAIGEGDAHKN